MGTCLHARFDFQGKSAWIISPIREISQLLFCRFREEVREVEKAACAEFKQPESSVKFVISCYSVKAAVSPERLP
jgi:hypothetical protein